MVFEKSILLCLLIAVVVAAVFYYVLKGEKKEGYELQVLSTSPEVEFIEGEPDYHLIDPVDGSEVVRAGDIALNPEFGVGEGTFGFGRYGSSFII